MTRLEVRLARLLVGLRGLALLRGWPFGEAAAADAQLDAVAAILGRPDEESMSTVVAVEASDVPPAYARWAHTYDLGNPIFTIEEPVVRRMLSDVPAGRALDAACGTGRHTALLAELGHDVVGVDGSPAMLERARNKGISASFVLADLRHCRSQRRAWTSPRVRSPSRISTRSRRRSPSSAASSDRAAASC